MELLPLVCVSLLTWSGTTFAAENEPTVITVKEGSDVTLNCTLSTKEDINFKVFDWKKDGKTEVFFYDAGIHYNNGREGQDQQFKRRVQHFPDKLTSGDASITIRNTKVNDSGLYTCEFPDLHPSQIFHIQLNVGSALKPSLKHLQQTRHWERLQCETRGDPEPELHWQDSAGNNLTADGPQVSQPDGYVTLQITVNKTGDYVCVATQLKIRHQINDSTHVYIEEKPVEVQTGFSIGFVVVGIIGTGVVVGVVVGLAVFVYMKTKYRGDVI